jgi:hypothetical protein
MKTKRLLSGILIMIVVLLANNLLVNAQEKEDVDFYTFSGIVKNKSNKKAVEYVNVSAVGTNIGTITNEDGEFTLKINKTLKVNEVQLSRIGYHNVLIPASNNNKTDEIYFMTPESFRLNEVRVFSWQNPHDLVKAAIEKIEENYAKKPNLLTGFYRETVQKRRKYINISEAVIEVYKDAYHLPADKDQVKILKGRKLISPKSSDTLSVKLIGGPNISLYLDMVKNPDILLNKETLYFYAFKMGEITSIDERLQYTVHFEPQIITDYPLYIGTLYIDRETLSFTRAEFKMDMRNKQKVTNMILKDKPRGLRFTPEAVSYVVSYKQKDGKTYMNYLRTEIEFKCDWKRRLFATNYNVIGEIIITDRDEQNVSRISNKETFSRYKSLSQEVSLYQDENFWSSYNIIEPTESLENAVTKLKKEHSKIQ